MIRASCGGGHAYAIKQPQPVAWHLQLCVVRDVAW